MSNFINIPREFNSIMSNAIRAEQYIYDDAIIAGTYIRLCLEAWVYWIYENDTLPIPYDKRIDALLREPAFQNLLAPEVIKQMHIIRKIGNRAAHLQDSSAKIRTPEVLHGLKLLHGLSYYLMGLYAEEYVPTPVFSEDNVPLAQQLQRNILQSQINELQKTVSQKENEIEKVKEDLQREKEALRLKHQSNIAIPKDPDEAFTRAIYIDALLEEMGWDMSLDNVKEFPLQDMPNASGNGFADYVLWGDDGKPLAVVEAKNTQRDAKVGQHQAELYARALEKKYGQLPNVFLTNGYKVYFYDWEYPLREVQGFYTKEQLELNIQRRTHKKSLSSIVINEGIAGRYYQIAAIKAVAHRLEQKHRGALLVMATGAGKTRTAAALIEMLANAGWAKRILFLADRVELVKQAKGSMNTYLPSFPAVNLTEAKENPNSRLVFSTYQTLINLIDNAKTENSGKLYGVGHFDVIIFDEIHRSVYNKYKAIFDYFDGIKIGLTATPKESTDKNTYELFGLPFGNPTYNYDLEQAIADGFLVPYKSYSVQTQFQREGIKYQDLSEEDKKEYEEKFGDPTTGEFPDEIESTALDQWLFNSNTVDLILQTLMEMGIRVDEGNQLGKTIIFCKNRMHSEFVRERFDANYPHYKGAFLKVIDYKTEYKSSLLDDFKTKEKMPQIACSVDMLDTGIDVPEVVNLVFLKPVKSIIKFNQMIGRGTRLCKDLFGYGQHKTEFLILDFCQNFEFFAENKKGVESQPQESLNTKIFNIRLDLAVLLLASQEEENQQIGHQILDVLHRQIVYLYTVEKDSFVVRPHIEMVERLQDRTVWNNLNKEDIRELKNHLATIVVDMDTDTPAKVLDLLMYYMMNYHTEGNLKMKMCVSRAQSYAQKLQKQTSIPQVKDKIQLLQCVCTEEYWAEISIETMERLRGEMRELMKFLEKTDQPIVKTDIIDEIVKNGEVTPHIRTTIDKDAYDRKMRQYINENKNHIVIDKLRRNIKVTTNDLEVLEQMLAEQGEEGDFHRIFNRILEEELDRKLETGWRENEAYSGKNLFGLFVRLIAGMERAELQEAFSKISNYAGLNIKQMEFLNVIIDTIAQNGILELSSIGKNPHLTSIHSGSIIELFGLDTAKEIVGVLKEIKDNTVA